MGDIIWAGIGLTILVLSTLLIIISFSTPYWIVSEDGAVVSTQLERLGLWEICFAGYADKYDSFGRTYNGCWWIFAREYDAIRRYIITGWFATTQALMTVSLILSMICVLFGLLMLMKCMPSKAQVYSAVFVCLSNYLIFLLVAVALIYFGTRADTDRSWLKAPTLRKLYWSFYLAAFGGILALLSAFAYTVYWMKVRVAGRHTTAYRAHELRTYRSDRYYK